MKKALDHADISVTEAADYLGVGTATIGRWINDRGPVPTMARRLWSTMTEVDEAWLETGTAAASATEVAEAECANRDLNPEPADMESRLAELGWQGLISDNAGLSANRTVALAPTLRLVVA